MPSTREILMSQNILLLRGGGRMLAAALLPALLLFGTAASHAADSPMWRDPDKPLAQRVANLVSLMTVDERAQQICDTAPSIPRLGVPAYNYWNECLHGVARNQYAIATVFPQAIGMAAMWDTNVAAQRGGQPSPPRRGRRTAMYTEHNNGDSAQYTGLNFWTPNINIFRDPRWGRGQETYGEDPFLTGAHGGGVHHRPARGRPELHQGHGLRQAFCGA